METAPLSPVFRRSNTYPYTETPLYTQNTGANYYESQGTPTQVSTPATSQTVASSGSVPMYVSGGQIIANPSGGSSAGGGGGGNGNGGGGGSTGGGGGGGSGSSSTGTYVIQGGYMLGSSSQSYSHTTRASPATVSLSLALDTLLFIQGDWSFREPLCFFQQLVQVLLEQWFSWLCSREPGVPWRLLRVL